METYLVKFWLQNPSGFLEQQSEIVKAKSKNHHKWVEDFIMKKHGIERKEIIGVYYQQRLTKCVRRKYPRRCTQKTVITNVKR